MHMFNAYFNALNIHHDVCIAVPDDLQVQFKAIILILLAVRHPDLLNLRMPLAKGKGLEGHGAED